MRVALSIVLMVCGGLTRAQDPTIPSPALLERLQAAPLVVRSESRPLPAIKLKSLVMRDSDHGTAIVESDGSRFQLNLDRAQLRQTDGAPPETDSRGRLQIGGVEYRVQDFYRRTIVLHDGVRRVLVQ